TISTTVIFYLFPFWGCFWYETGDIPNISGHKQIVCPDLMRSWSEKTGLGKMAIVIIIETINYIFYSAAVLYTTGLQMDGHGQTYCVFRPFRVCNNKIGTQWV
ncbi:MAG: hypothetical protein ACI377_12155, partial [Bacteroides fragilis]